MIKLYVIRIVPPGVGYPEPVALVVFSGTDAEIAAQVFARETRQGFDVHLVKSGAKS